MKPLAEKEWVLYYVRWVYHPRGKFINRKIVVRADCLSTAVAKFSWDGQHQWELSMGWPK